MRQAGGSSPAGSRGNDADWRWASGRPASRSASRSPHWPAALASCISVADNGLAFTAVAELAGPRWSGRALGIQNTGQFLAAAVVPPAVGALIGVAGYPVAFAVVALVPVIAAPLILSARVEELAG